MTIVAGVNWRGVVTALVCSMVLGAEVYLVFVNRSGEFRIQGEEVYDLTAFGSGRMVAHSFLMRGDGLNSVSVQFGSDSWVNVEARWTLWRGMADQPEPMTRAFEGADVIDLRPGHQWRTFEFTRDASSRDRWYTFEVRALAVERLAPSRETPAVTPQVALVASSDNPERGGVLWVDGARRSGSLAIRAGRNGRTLYRRFVAEVEPNLPAPLRIRFVQWTVVVAFHWAFLVFAWVVIHDSRRGPSCPSLT